MSSRRCSAYVLLGLIVEHVARQPLGAYLERNVFTPAGMNETTFLDPPPGAPMAVGYGFGESIARQDDMSWYYSCASMASTASDLAKFDIALMGGKLLPPASFDRMLKEAQPTQDVRCSSYGLGIQVFPLGSIQMVGHHGGLPGFETDNLMIPRDGSAMIVLSNGAEFPTSAFTDLSLSILYPSLTAALRGHPRAPPADAYPATTSFVRQFLKDLQRGYVDAAQLAPAMRAYMTDATVTIMHKELADLGAVKSVTWLGVQRVGTSLQHHYRITFKTVAKTMTFVFTQDGKLAAILSD